MEKHKDGEKLPQKLRVSKKFRPCPIDADDELFRNGIFEFNITKMMAFILSHPGKFVPEQIALNTIPDFSSSLDPTTVEKATLSNPVILAEISPGRFNVIDGNHRVKKARLSGAAQISAYRILPQEHCQFMTSDRAYECYVSYWNEKVRDEKRKMPRK